MRRRLSLAKERLTELGAADLGRVAAAGAEDTLDSTCLCNSVWAVQDLLDRVVVQRPTHTYCSH